MFDVAAADKCFRSGYRTRLPRGRSRRIFPRDIFRKIIGEARSSKFNGIPGGFRQFCGEEH